MCAGVQTAERQTLHSIQVQTYINSKRMHLWLGSVASATHISADAASVLQTNILSG